MSMQKKRLLPCVFAVGLALLAHQSFAQELVARSQLRRTVDPSTRSARGSVLMTVDTKGNQTFQIRSPVWEKPTLLPLPGENRASRPMPFQMWPLPP